MKDHAHVFLAQAARIAERTIRKNQGGPFGAVIAQGTRVIAAASNSVLASHDPTCHAEVNAIRAACEKLGTHLLTGLDIYSTTEPCPMCFSAIHWAQMKHVYYGTTIADVKKLGFNELTVSNVVLKKLGKSPVGLTRVSDPSCRALLKTWASLPKAQVY